MEYAPIIMVALCRDELLRRAIESLKRNTFAEKTDIYIAVDFPPKNEYVEGYERIKEYLSGDFEEFKSFNVIYRERNYGVRKNRNKLTEFIRKKYDIWIDAAEDLEYSPNFIQYMDEMLDRYRDDESVVAVTGYSFPVEWKVHDSCNAMKVQFTANEWGLGHWKDKWEVLHSYLEHYGLQKDFGTAYKSNRFSHMSDWAIKDYVGVTYGVTPVTSFWLGVYDVSLRVYIAVNNKYVIMPKLSKVRNLGYDGSGINCPKTEYDENRRVSSTNYDFSRQPIDENPFFSPAVDEDCDESINLRLLNEFDYVDPEIVEKSLQRADFYSNNSNFYRHFMNINHFLNGVKKRLL